MIFSHRPHAAGPTAPALSALIPQLLTGVLRTVLTSVLAGVLAGVLATLLASAPAAAQSCGVRPQKGWSKAEQTVWAGLCVAGLADLSEPGKGDCDARADGDWGEERRISGAFLREALTESPYREALGGSAHLRCVRVEGALDLSHRVLPGALLIERSRLTGGISLLGAAAPGLVSLRGSVISGGIDAEGLRAGGDLYLREIGVIGAVSLAGARLEGALEAAGARVEGGLDLADARIAGRAVLENAEIRRGLRLAAAEIAGETDLSGALVDGVFAAEGSALAGGLRLDRIAAAATARLDGARLGGPLLAREAGLGQGLSATGARIAAADFSAARFGGWLDLSEARIGALRLDGAAAAAGSGISLRRAEVARLESPPSAWPSAARDLRALRLSGGAALEAPAASLIAWLAGGLGAEGEAKGSPARGSADAAEAAGAYRALAAALAAAGRPGAAAEARYAAGRAEIAGGEGSVAARIGWTLLDWTAGLGHRPFRALAWGAALAALGAALAASHPRLAPLGAARLFRLSVENALVWPAFSGQYRLLYRIGDGYAALFALQRLLGAALLAAAAISSLLAAAGRI